MLNLLPKTVPILLLAALGSAVVADDPWSDPTFQKQFLGSYGFQAELEPKVSAEERVVMERVMAVMGTDLAAAAAELEAGTTEASSAVLDFTLANIYFQQDRLEDAAGRYATAIEKFPSFRRALKNLGLIEVRRGDFPAAIKALTRVVELGGGDALTFGLLGHAYGSTDQSVPAESAYRNAMLLQPDVADWKVGLTQSVLKQKKYAEAAALCDELIARYPERTEFLMLQANAYIGLNEPRKAAENYELLQHLGKASVPTLQTLGDIYINDGLWGLAARAYRQAIELDPDQDLDRPLRSVEILAQRGAVTEAQALLSAIKGIYGDRVGEDGKRKLLKLEARLAVAGGGGGEALGILEQLVALDPLDGEALLLLGQHYGEAGEHERAIFYYERAESLAGFEADASVRHAQLLVGQSRYPEAVPLLKRAQELKPRDEVARFLDEVERIARTRR